MIHSFFSKMLAVVLDFLTLHDKHNESSLLVRKSFALAAKHARKAHQVFSFLPVFKYRTNKLYIFRQYTIYIYEEFEDSLSESVNRRRTDNTMAKYNRNRNLLDINNKIFHLNINI